MLCSLKKKKALMYNNIKKKILSSRALAQTAKFANITYYITFANITFQISYSLI